MTFKEAFQVASPILCLSLWYCVAFGFFTYRLFMNSSWVLRITRSTEQFSTSVNIFSDDLIVFSANVSLYGN
jgi:hypothetical protein